MKKIAEKYVDAFGKLARESTAVVVPGNVGDIGGMIATGMSVFGKVNSAQSQAIAEKIVRDQQSDEQSQRHQDTDGSKKDSVIDSMVNEFDNTTSKQ